ncbi:MAG: hypothetical protein MPJ22_10775, partial [Pirellulales bacterium]|nr:hypothetical protein [Pirellulales bacterium]
FGNGHANLTRRQHDQRLEENGLLPASFCHAYQPIDSEQDCLTRQQISPHKAGWVTSDATKSSK